VNDTDAIPVHITGWDRAAIIALGAAGCALSYDALQQMAVAVHIRGGLTWIFPLVIDGFIGYGVRALLVMRSASLAARCYVWALFGTATVASIWANALHAVRLNDQSGGGALRLGDVTVGVLSTLAPLALAGAVHLYILIARRAAAQPGKPDMAATTGVRTARVTAGSADTPDGQDTARLVTGHQLSELSAGTSGRSEDSRPDTWGRKPLIASEAEPTPPDGKPDARLGHSGQGRPSDQHESGSDMAASPAPAAPPPVGPGEADDLLPLARRAVSDAGKLTRKVVADSIRGQGHPLSNDRLTELMQKLRKEADNRTLRPRA